MEGNCKMSAASELTILAEPLAISTNCLQNLAGAFVRNLDHGILGNLLEHLMLFLL